jgi:L-alanine-DL-glutamate epimerase-like enolase superfamily enzyme
MSTWGRLAELPIDVEGYELEGLERDVSSAFTRMTTVVRLRGGGEEGVGEDVTYEGEDHVRQLELGPVLDLAGSWTLASLSEHLGGLDLFPAAPPEQDAFRLYRRWAFESAALDLALRQAGKPLHEALGIEPRPVTFVVSLRLGDPATIDPVRRRLERYPNLRFKLDPTSDWDDDLVAELVATGAVDSVDLKGMYVGTIVDQGADPELYARVAAAFPEAWIEDPALTPETEEVLRPHRERITWDAPIHSVEDITSLAFRPRMINIKPSRFGSLPALLEGYDFCAREGIEAYGGGQFELGPGRGQIQYLASLFHPDTPNDVAPGAYNAPEPAVGLPESPLPPAPADVGFRWGP